MRITPDSPMRCQGSPSTSASSWDRVNARGLPSFGQTNLPAFNRRATNQTCGWEGSTRPRVQR